MADPNAVVKRALGEIMREVNREVDADRVRVIEEMCVAAARLALTRRALLARRSAGLPDCPQELLDHGYVVDVRERRRVGVACTGCGTIYEAELREGDERRWLCKECS